MKKKNTLQYFFFIKNNQLYTNLERNVRLKSERNLNVLTFPPGTMQGLPWQLRLLLGSSPAHYPSHAKVQDEIFTHLDGAKLFFFPVLLLIKTSTDP